MREDPKDMARRRVGGTTVLRRAAPSNARRRVRGASPQVPGRATKVARTEDMAMVFGGERVVLGGSF